MYEVETRKMVLIPSNDRRAARDAADLLGNVKGNLSKLGFKSQDVVRIGNYHFRLAEIQRAAAFCEQFSAADITL